MKIRIMEALRRRARLKRALAAPADFLFYGIESPKPHRIRWDGPTSFQGTVLDVRDRAIPAIELRQDGRLLETYPVDQPNPIIASYLPRFSSASRCRFAFERAIEPTAEEWTFVVVHADGEREELLSYPIGEARRQRGRHEALYRALRTLPMPEGRLVFLTQGHEDVEGYEDSILAGAACLKRYLAHAGVAETELRSLLDFGCGTGRLLAGLSLEIPALELHGCDINAELVACAATALAGRAEVRTTALRPPLPYDDAQFDAVTLLSVFTHLSRETQEEWVREFRRVLRPGGVVLATLCGELYVHLGAPGRLDEFRRTGYLENVSHSEGGNAYGTFHDVAAAKAIFSGFRLEGCYPTGRIDGRRVPFQIAAAQDVYVWRKV